MKRPLSPEELQIPYSKYFDGLPVDGPTEEEYGWMAQPLAPEQVLPIEQAANFVLAGGAFVGAPNGYYIFPDGRSYTANTMVLPGLTVELCQWWFRWLNSYHPKHVSPECGNLRYKIWCPPDHWDHAPGRIVESFDLGAGAEPKVMRNAGGDPAALGITPEMLAAAQAEGRFPGVGCGFTDEMIPTGVGVNQFRDVPGGCEWSSRSWSGYAIREGRLIRLENPLPVDPADPRNEMLHNLTEGRHLAKLLPLIYAEYKDKPWEED